MPKTKLPLPSLAKYRVEADVREQSEHEANAHLPAACGLGELRFVKGDATQPYRCGRDYLVHVVNNRAVTWGAGFGKVVARKWPSVQAHFANWVFSNRNNLRLGTVCTFELTHSFVIAQLIAQKGYGPSANPRICYPELRECLEKVAVLATQAKAIVHMPRIGCGEAGGDWSIVEQIIKETLVKKGLKVVVYDLPPKVRKSRRSDATTDRPTLWQDIIWKEYPR